MSDSSEQSTPVFDTKIASALNKAGQEALEPFAEQMFTDRGGEWYGIVRLTHKERNERVRTDGDYDYVQKTGIVRILDIEVMPEADSHTAHALMKRVRDRRLADAESEALHAEDGLFANGAP